MPRSRSSHCQSCRGIVTGRSLPVVAVEMVVVAMEAMAAMEAIGVA